MEPFSEHEAASKGVHVTLTTKVKVYCSCNVGSLMNESRRWPDASPVVNGFIKPVKTSVMPCLKEKLILHVVNFECFILNSLSIKKKLYTCKIHFKSHKLQYHLSLGQYHLELRMIHNSMVQQLLHKNKHKYETSMYYVCN